MLVDIAREARIRLALLDFATADTDEIYSLNEHANHTGMHEIPGDHVWDEVEEYFDTNFFYRGRFVEITRSCYPYRYGFEFVRGGQEHTGDGCLTVKDARDAAKVAIDELMAV
jgi:hypothetical protein